MVLNLGPCETLVLQERRTTRQEAARGLRPLCQWRNGIVMALGFSVVLLGRRGTMGFCRVDFYVR